MAEYLKNSIILVIAYFIGHVNSHAALTFPPARQLDLDFLDYFRTKGPCGMPKGKLKTTLMAGSIINVTWHLSYPHKGGFRIELMDKNEKFIEKLSEPESNSSHVTGDPTAQWHTVKLPDKACEDCTIRFLRLAKEWKDYGYWSCADVSIVKASDYKEDCFGRGKPISNSICTCDKGYWGPRCQYKEECDNDNDCGNGKCIDLKGTSLPRKQCFCHAGFHGERCQLQNKVTLPTPENLHLSNHKKIELSDRIQLYHKIVSASSKDDAEIEVILVVNGTSYIAFGFRPASFNQSCQEMPAVEENAISTRRKRAARNKSHKNPTLLEPLKMPEKIMAEPESSMAHAKHSPAEKKNKTPIPEPERTKEPTSEPEGASEPASEPEKISEPKGEPEGSSEPIPEAEGEPNGKQEPTSEPKGEPEGVTEPVPETEPTGEPEANSEPKVEPESQGEPSAEPETSSEPKGEPETSSEPKVEPESQNEPSAEPETSSEPKGEPETSGEPKVEPETSSEPEVSSTKNSPKTKRQPEEPEPESEPEKATLQVEPEMAADESMSAIVLSEPEPGHRKAASILDAPSPFKLEKRRTAYTPPMNDFHPMDCTDIIIGTARGMHSRIRDYYTRDRSTPRLDTYWGGTEDLTSATGWEKDGVTTIIFRRKLKSSDPTDHTIDGRMHVIFARGQEHGEYVHNPPSGLEAENPSIPKFYAQDEIKYHGQSQQRGVRFINFAD